MEYEGVDSLEENVSQAAETFDGAVVSNSPTKGYELFDSPKTGEVTGEMIGELLSGQNNNRSVETDSGEYEVLGEEAVAAIPVDQDSYLLVYAENKPEEAGIQHPDVAHVDADIVNSEDFTSRANSPIQEAWNRSKDGSMNAPSERLRSWDFDEPDYEVSSFKSFPESVPLYAAHKLGRGFGRAEHAAKNLLDR